MGYFLFLNLDSCDLLKSNHEKRRKTKMVLLRIFLSFAICMTAFASPKTPLIPKSVTAAPDAGNLVMEDENGTKTDDWNNAVSLLEGLRERIEKAKNDLEEPAAGFITETDTSKYTYGTPGPDAGLIEEAPLDDDQNTKIITGILEQLEVVLEMGLKAQEVALEVKKIAKKAMDRREEEEEEEAEKKAEKEAEAKAPKEEEAAEAARKAAKDVPKEEPLLPFDEPHLPNFRETDTEKRRE